MGNVQTGCNKEPDLTSNLLIPMALSEKLPPETSCGHDWGDKPLVASHRVQPSPKPGTSLPPSTAQG